MGYRGGSNVRKFKNKNYDNATHMYGTVIVVGIIAFVIGIMSGLFRTAVLI